MTDRFPIDGVLPPNGQVRIGLSTSRTGIQAVAVSESGLIIAASTAPRQPSLDDSLVAVLKPMLEQVDVRTVSSVALATAWLAEQTQESGTHARVGVLRIGLTSTGVPPLSGWPVTLAAQIDGPRAIVAGGTDVDGRPLADLDFDAVDTFARQCQGSVSAVAISSVFSPLNAEHELSAAVKIRSVLGSVPITLSHTVGGFGLLERENAAILNASLRTLGATLVSDARAALDRVGVAAELYLAQNDGTLLNADAAAAMPVRVFDSRLATSANGAARGAAVSDAIVIDFDDDLPRASVVQGGQVALESDRSSLAGVRVIQYLPRGFDLPRSSNPVDRLRRYARYAPLFAVGDLTGAGGEPPLGATVPEHAQFASAIGAATADVSASVSGYIDSAADRDELLEQTRQRAVEEAILVGAHPSFTRVTAVHETPISHMVGEPRRLVVIAAGPPFSFANDSMHFTGTTQHNNERNAP